MTTGDYRDVVSRRKAIEAKRKANEKLADRIKRTFDGFRTNLLLTWLFSNILVVVGCVYFVDSDLYLPILYASVGCFNLCRLVGSVMYLIYASRQSCLFACLLNCGILKRRHRRNINQQQHIRNSIQLQVAGQYHNHGNQQPFTAMN